MENQKTLNEGEPRQKRKPDLDACQVYVDDAGQKKFKKVGAIWLAQDLGKPSRYGGRFVIGELDLVLFKTKRE